MSDDDDSLTKPAKQLKPRSEAQAAAFAKARETRAANIELKKAAATAKVNLHLKNKEKKLVLQAIKDKLNGSDDIPDHQPSDDELIDDEPAPEPVPAPKPTKKISPTKQSTPKPKKEPKIVYESDSDSEPEVIVVKKKKKAKKQKTIIIEDSSDDDDDYQPPSNKKQKEVKEVLPAVAPKQAFGRSQQHHSSAPRIEQPKMQCYFA